MGEPVCARQRSWSLRREWTRAFLLMLALMLGTGASTIFVVWHLVGQLNGVADQRDRETGAVDALRTDLVDHEQIGHQLLSDKPIDRAAFLRQQVDVDAEFNRAIKTFPADNGTRPILRAAQQSWQQGLTEAGLWGDQVLSVTGPHLPENPIFGAASDTARGMLDDLNRPSLNAMRQGLADGKRSERYMIMFLIALFALALGVTGHFRRRMSRDLLGPVAAMRLGVLKLRSGELAHRIPITRNDELGELAAAFNGMTDELWETSKALTHRATRDALTGLANRHTVTEHLLAAFDGNSDRATSCSSLLFLDVDNFKDVNDSLGHEAGDTFLVELVGRLTGCVGPDDLVGRLGGDEFAIVVAQAEGRSGSDVAERILLALEPPVNLKHSQLDISVSIGVAERSPQTADPTELLRQADFAMYLAKGAGKGRYRVFEAHVHDSMTPPGALRPDWPTATSIGESGSVTGRHQI